MQKYFSCERCEISQGHEQPAYVREDAPEALLPGVCLINSDPKSVPIQCSAHHPNTIRLCACV